MEDTLGIQWPWCRYRTCIATALQTWGKWSYPMTVVRGISRALHILSVMRTLALFPGPWCILEIMQLIHMDSWPALSVTMGFPCWPFLPLSPVVHAATASGDACLGLLHPSWPGMCDATDADFCPESTFPTCRGCCCQSLKSGAWPSGAFGVAEATPKQRAFWHLLMLFIC